MRWQFSARLTSLIVLAVISLAVGGAALGLALARGGSPESAREVARHMDKAGYVSKSKTEPRTHGKSEVKGDSDRYERSMRKRMAERFEKRKAGRDRFHHWWGSRRVVVVPRYEALPGSTFRGEFPITRRTERAQPERQVVRPGGMVIAVGEVTAVRDSLIEMFTVLGNEVTIDISQLGEGPAPDVGAAAIVIAARDGDGYVAQSMNLLDGRLSEMLEGRRARSRSAP